MMNTPYTQGFIDGMTAYGISKNGQLILGNDRPLKSCIEGVRDTWNFNRELDQYCVDLVKVVQQSLWDISVLRNAIGQSEPMAGEELGDAVLAKIRGA